MSTLDELFDHAESNTATLDDLFNQAESQGTTTPAGHGMGDLKAAENPAPLDPYQTVYGMDGKPIVSPGLSVPLNFMGNAAQSLSTGPINAAVQGIQDKGFTGAGAWQVGKNEVKSAINPFVPGPNPIQSSTQSLERAGVPNTPQTVYGMDGKPINTGTGLADILGGAADTFTPVWGIGAAGKAAELTKAGLASEAVTNALKGARGAFQKPISDLSKIDPALLAKASTPEGLAEIRQGAAINSQQLGSDIADKAQAVNDYRQSRYMTDKSAQDQQIQQINDQLALENQQVNAQVQNQAQATNEQRQALANASAQTQSQQVEQGLLDARKSATGSDAQSLSDIKPEAAGEALNTAVTSSKTPMQNAWVEGNAESLGKVRDKPVATFFKENPETGDMERKKVLTQNLTDVLKEFKAFNPTQGVRKISAGATGAINRLIGLSEQGGHTIDDLMNIRAEARRIQLGDKFDGNPFDKTTDSFAFGKVNNAIDKTLYQSVNNNAGAQAAKDILSINKAIDGQYATAKGILGYLAGSAGQTRNSANVIKTVSAMGPEKAAELLKTAESNPAIAGIVPHMRQAFVDDLLLSSMKDGSLDVGKLSARWKAPGFQGIKNAWLAPEDVQRIDHAIELGNATIEKPALVAAQKIPMPAKVVAQNEILKPEKVGDLFSYKGNPNDITAETRVRNIGGKEPINQRAKLQLAELDKIKLGDEISGTNYGDLAQKVYEASQLGMDASGKMSSISMSNTGRSGLGAHMGEAIGAIIGGPAGLLLHGGVSGALEGTAVGGTLGRLARGGAQYAQSPAGAVAAWKFIDKTITNRWPKVGRLVKALHRTSDERTKAALTLQITRILNDQTNKGDQ